MLARFVTAAADGFSYDIDRSATNGALLAVAASRRPWEAVRWDFDRAGAMLAPPPAGAEGSAARLAESLDHNELELTLDELESLGENGSAPREAFATGADVPWSLWVIAPPFGAVAVDALTSRRPVARSRCRDCWRRNTRSGWRG